MNNEFTRVSGEDVHTRILTSWCQIRSDERSEQLSNEKNPGWWFDIATGPSSFQGCGGAGQSLGRV